MDAARVSHDRRLLRLAVYAVTIAVAFFVSFTGEAYGEMPPVASSVLWWPGALLTAALLLTPRRHWLALLLAGLAAHLTAQLANGWRLTATALFLAQCGQAVSATARLQA